MLRRLFYLQLFLILVSGCSKGDVSYSPDPIPSNPPPSTINQPELQPQFNQTDQAFLTEIETFARNNGTTFTDVPPETNVNTAKTICSGIQTNGVSNSFENYVNYLATQSNMSESDQIVLGYLFSASVKYYCPQYMADVQNLLTNLGY